MVQVVTVGDLVCLQGYDCVKLTIRKLLMSSVL